MADNVLAKEQMVLGPEALNCGIQKRLVHAGKAPIEYVDGTKVYFHFKTTLADDPTVVVDDSKKMDPNKPMEIIIGKKFKLEVWERALKTMWLGETARFTVVKQLLFDYPVVSKQLRDYYKYNPDKCGSDKCTHDHHKKNNQQQQQRQHCCGFNLIEHGVGHADLDRLLKIPQSLDFVLELIRAEQPGDYKKDSWALSEQEQVAIVPVLKEQGSELFKKKLYSEACEKYKEAVGHVEQLMLKEKPHDVDWNRLNEQKMPLLLNYAMCKFNMNEFYECIEHTTAILESQPANVKAMFRRAKAYAAVWSFAEARADFAKCVELDASLLAEVNAQLASLKKAQEIHEKEEKDKFRGKLFS